MSHSLIFIGALPPPVHGQAVINNQMLSGFKSQDHISLHICDTSPGTLKKSLFYHIKRITKVLKTIGTIFKARLFEKAHLRTIYLSSDGGLGLAYSLLYCLFGRLLGYRIFSHYHSFALMLSPSIFMKLIVALSGKHLTHIFLCELMRYHFIKSYGEVTSFCLRNTVFLQTQQLNQDHRICEKQDNYLTIGFMSNLYAQKGFYDFLEVIDKITQSKLPVKAYLAGPIVHENDQKYLDDFITKIPSGSLTYLGPIYKSQKEDFYRNIDVFLFPTRYKTEAQPNVIFEAFSYSCPVISFNSGGIASQLNLDLLENKGTIPQKIRDNWSRLVPQNENFADHTLYWLKNFLSDPELLIAAQKYSRKVYERHLEQSKNEYDHALKIICT